MKEFYRSKWNILKNTYPFLVKVQFSSTAKIWVTIKWQILNSNLSHRKVICWLIVAAYESTEELQRMFVYGFEGFAITFRFIYNACMKIIRSFHVLLLNMSHQYIT